jgi:two-component system, NarL family, response regulator DesR
MRTFSTPIRLLIADKIYMYAEGIRTFLRMKPQIGDIEIVCSNEAINQALHEQQPDALIVEPWSIGGETGHTDLKMLSTLRHLYPRCHIVVFTAESKPSVLRQLAELQSVGLSSKADDPESVLEVLERVVGGGQGVMSPRVAVQIASGNLLISREIPAFTQRARTPDF